MVEQSILGLITPIFPIGLSQERNLVLDHTTVEKRRTIHGTSALLRV